MEIKLVYRFILCLCFCGFVKTSFAQDSTLLKPFRKGRILLGMSGSINSSNFLEGEPQDSIINETSNGFTVNFNASRVLNRQIAVGVQGFLRRTSQQNIINQNLESLAIGPYADFFLSDNPNGSVYPRVSVLYGRFYEEVFSNYALLHREFTGSAIGVQLGFGFSYVYKDVAALDLRLNYSAFRLNGRTYDVIHETYENTGFTKANVDFNFGIYFLLNGNDND